MTHPFMRGRLRYGPAFVATLAMLAAGCGTEPTAPAEPPALARGGKPGGGSSTLIPLVKLANLKSLRCSSAEAHGISSTGPARVVGAASCGGQMRLFGWTSSSGGYLIGGPAEDGIAEGVANDGTAVGWYFPGPGLARAFAVRPGGAVTPLPADARYLSTNAYAITPDGRFVVGNGLRSSAGAACDGNSACASDVLLWTRAADGAYSSEPVVVSTDASGTAISANGETVLGTVEGHAVLWTRSTGWARQVLPHDLGAAVALSSAPHAINGAGDVIAGERRLPSLTNPGRSYEEHVVWKRQGGAWELEPLRGFNISEGIAADVEDYNGLTVAVGHSWDNTKGTGGTLWPVYWSWDRREGTTFGGPQRLSQLSEAWGAVATAINPGGQVVGTAATGSVANAAYPVMWQLP